MVNEVDRRGAGWEEVSSNDLANYHQEAKEAALEGSGLILIGIAALSASVLANDQSNPGVELLTAFSGAGAIACGTIYLDRMNSYIRLLLEEAGRRGLSVQKRGVSLISRINTKTTSIDQDLLNTGENPN